MVHILVSFVVVVVFFPTFIFPSCSALVISQELANMCVIDVAR